MSLSRAAALGLSLLSLGACRSNVTWVPDAKGRMIALRNEPVRLPGLGYLILGQPRHHALVAIRDHGFDCSEEAASHSTQACVRPPGREEPTGGVVMMTFEQGILAGVQAQLQPEGDDTGSRARERFDRIEQEWSQAFGKAQEIRRPGILAARHSLRDGTALLAVCYDGEPTLIVEHVQQQLDDVHIPPPSRDTGTR